MQLSHTSPYPQRLFHGFTLLLPQQLPSAGLAAALQGCHPVPGPAGLGKPACAATLGGLWREEASGFEDELCGEQCCPRRALGS